MKHFCYISSFSLYTTKTQSTHYQEHIQTRRNLPQLKKMALKQNYTPQKRDFGCEKVLFSPSRPPQIPSKHRCRAVLDCPQSTPLRPVLQTKDSAFWWRDTPSVERSTTMSKNSSAFYAEQTTFRQKSSSFLTKWPRGKRAPPTLCRNNVEIGRASCRERV